MMFIVRSGHGEPPASPGIQIKLRRKTPARLKDSAGNSDFFCTGDAAAVIALREGGWTVVELRDGYYADDTGGGVAIWGQGRYWEIRDTPFTIREAVGATAPTGDAAAGEHVNVRGAIFGA
ncbi:MAG TPA: hypothetical protein VFX06_11415 [Stellaceae bacterium]|nr:hypothetical protein [Stellaceae bacterium]